MNKLIVFLLLFATGVVANAQSLVIKNTNVINVKSGEVASGVSVVIENNRIKKIVKGEVSGKGLVVDGKNKYLMPGLWDMHTHTFTSKDFFPLLIGNGVTGIRDMFGQMDSLSIWKKQIASGNMLGPVIFASGPIVDGPKPVWPGSVALGKPEQVQRTIDSLKNILKVDFIKVYSLLPRQVYFKIAEEAKKQNIPFAGHVPNEVTILESAKAGQKSQEHLYGIMQESSDSADYLIKVSQKLIVDSALLDRTKRMKMMIRTFNPKKRTALIKNLAQYDTWICPTLNVNRSIGHLNDTLFTNDPRLHYMMPGMKEWWNPANDFRFKTSTKEYYDAYRKIFELMLSTTKEMHQAGIKLLAGTDYSNPYCFPGFSLHDELQLMVQAGLKPLDALQTATINPALFFGITNDYGTVEEGKIANLLLLDKNPLENIDYTRSINGVIVNGKFLDKEKLQGMLQKLWHK